MSATWWPAVILAVLGMGGGLVIDGIALSFERERSFRLRFRHGAWSSGRCARLAATCLAVAALAPLVGLPLWGQPVALLIALTETALLAAIARIDLATRLVPSLLVALLVLCALVGATRPGAIGVPAALLGGGAGYAFFAAVALVVRGVSGKGALGLGDAHVALAIGCIVGYPDVVDALALGVVLGVVGAIALLSIRRDRRATMAYTPYLALGAMLFIAGVEPHTLLM